MIYDDAKNDIILGFLNKCNLDLRAMGNADYLQHFLNQILGIHNDIGEDQTT